MRREGLLDVSALDTMGSLLWQETIRVAMGKEPTNAAGRRLKYLIGKHGGLKRVRSPPSSACSSTAWICVLHLVNDGGVKSVESDMHVH